MIIRALQPNDIEQLKQIHIWHYRNEFEFPDFLNNYLCAFVVTDNNGRIISGGGVRAIAEAVVVTDKNRSVKDRRDALLQVLDASCFITKQADFPRLHAVTDDEQWAKHLENVGFHSRGKLLAIGL
jgi:IMP cyclohydrolase